jgi:hypothetical protein
MTLDGCDERERHPGFQLNKALLHNAACIQISTEMPRPLRTASRLSPAHTVSHHAPCPS